MSGRELAAIAATIPVPVDAGGPARAYVELVTVRPPAWRAWFALEGGRVREPVGPTFARARDARALSRALNADR